MKHNWFNTGRALVGSVLAALALASCGGGGVTPDNSSNADINGAYTGTTQAGVQVLTATQMAAVTQATPLDGGGLALTSGSDLSQYKVGDVITLPPDAQSGLQLGYTGKVVTASDGGLVLRPAKVEEAFSALNFNVDTTASTANVVGVIAPPGTQSTFTQKPAAALQSGVAAATCQVGLTFGFDPSNTLGCDKNSGTVNGEVKLVTTIENDAKQKATLTTTININNLRAMMKGEYDPKKYSSSKDGWGSLSAQISGDVGVNVNLAAVDKSFELPDWSQFYNKAMKSWWDNLSTNAGPLKIAGLDGTDKKGMVPLGGILLSAAGTVAPFAGSLSNVQLGAYKQGSVIFWVYLNVNGSISVQGTLDLLQTTQQAHFERGFDMRLVGDKLVSSPMTNNDKPGVYQMPHLNGKMTVAQNLGLSLAGDLFIGGIRPMNITAHPLVARYDGFVEGDGGLEFSASNPKGLFTGGVCASNTVRVFSAVAASLRLNAELDTAWKTYGIADIDKHWGYDASNASSNQDGYVEWYGDTKAACATSPAITATVAKSVLQSAASAFLGKVDYDVDYSQSYASSALKNLVKTWQLTYRSAAGGGLTTVTLTPETDGGNLVVALPHGQQIVELVGLYSDGQLAVGRYRTVIDVPAAPSVTSVVTLASGNTDCKALALNALVTPFGSATIQSVKWEISKNGSVLTTASGAKATATLPGCGVVQVKVTVADSQGMTTVNTKSVDTNNLLASVTSITPAATNVSIGVPSTYTVVGKNLPPTALLAIQDATCDAPNNIKADGTSFSQSCTVNGTTGSKAITVKTDTQANGGVVIDASKTVTVVPSCAANQVLQNGVCVAPVIASSCGRDVTNVVFSENFATALDSTKWVTGLNGGAVSSGGNKITLSSPVTSFPLVQAVNPSIPATGNFSFYCKAKYNHLGASGAGACMMTDLLPNGDGSSAFGVWGGGGQNTVGISFSGKILYPSADGIVSNYANDLGTHEYEFCVVDSNVSIYRDGSLIGSKPLPTGWKRPSKLWLGHMAHTSPDWSSFETNKVEVRQLSSSAPNPFRVAANSIPGATFQVPSGVSSCHFMAGGTWSAWTGYPAFTSTPDGIISMPAPSNRGVPVPSSYIGALVAKRSSTNVWEVVGSSKVLAVNPNEVITFMMNDATDSGFTDQNSGSLTVGYSCS